MDEEIDIFQCDVVPKHEVLSDDEKIRLLGDLKISIRQLPRIRENDAVVKALKAKKEDVIKISRNSPTGGTYYYYRVVVSEKKRGEGRS